MQRERSSEVHRQGAVAQRTWNDEASTRDTARSSPPLLLPPPSSAPRSSAIAASDSEPSLLTAFEATDAVTASRSAAESPGIAPPEPAPGTNAPALYATHCPDAGAGDAKAAAAAEEDDDEGEEEGSEAGCGCGISCCKPVENERPAAAGMTAQRAMAPRSCDSERAEDHRRASASLVKGGKAKCQ